MHGIMHHASEILIHLADGLRCGFYEPDSTVKHPWHSGRRKKTSPDCVATPG